MKIVHAFLAALFGVGIFILHLLIWVLIIGAIMSWLVALNILNRHNPFVRQIGDVIFRITEPLLKPIRRFVPPVNGIDFSPFILILIILFIQTFLSNLEY